jgi:hypothetical protein
VGDLASSHGLKAGDFGGASHVNGMVGHAVVGCASSAGAVLGGGKFENGAVTGAFGYLFNNMAQETYSGTGATPERPAALDSGRDWSQMDNVDKAFVITIGAVGAAPILVEAGLAYGAGVTYQQGAQWVGYFGRDAATGVIR